MQRLFVQKSCLSDSRLLIDQSTYSHLFSVCRLKIGDCLTLISDRDRYCVQIDFFDKKKINFTIVDHLLLDLPAISFTLIQSLPKQDKFSQICRMCIEAGVHSIFPVLTSRTDVRLRQSAFGKKRERYQQIIHSAACQSQRNELPYLYDLGSLEALDQLSGFDSALKIVFYEESGPEHCLKSILSSSLQSISEVVFFIGPEGGFSAEEICLLKEKGFVVASLGSTVLRVEHAAFYALAQFNCFFSDLV